MFLEFNGYYTMKVKKTLYYNAVLDIHSTKSSFITFNTIVVNIRKDIRMISLN